MQTLNAPLAWKIARTVITIFRVVYAVMPFIYSIFLLSTQSSDSATPTLIVCTFIFGSLTSVTALVWIKKNLVTTPWLVIATDALLLSGLFYFALDRNLSAIFWNVSVSAAISTYLSAMTAGIIALPGVLGFYLLLECVYFLVRTSATRRTLVSLLPQSLSFSPLKPRTMPYNFDRSFTI